MNIQSLNRLELISEFRTVPLFSALDDDQLLRIISRVNSLRLGAGSPVFYRGDPAESFYMVRTGQVQLFLESSDGNEKVIDIVKPGQLFAEAVTFFEGQKYPVNAVVLQDCELLSINIALFRNILRESIDTCFSLLASMCQRLHIQLMEIDNLTLHNATYRLVFHLLKSVPPDSADKMHVALTYPKNVLASLLSIKPETLSRILARLKKSDIIDVQGNEIIIKNVEDLRQFLTESSHSN